MTLPTKLGHSMLNKNFQETIPFKSHTSVNFQNSSCLSSYSQHLRTNIMLHAHYQLGATQDTKLGQPRVTSYTSMKPGATRKKSTNMTKDMAFFRVKSNGRLEQPKNRK